MQTDENSPGVFPVCRFSRQCRLRRKVPLGPTRRYWTSQHVERGDAVGRPGGWRSGNQSAYSDVRETADCSRGCGTYGS
jgi:hypothetical protein